MCSAEGGLLLLLMHVTKDSPAWMCGLRDGDAIVSVNEWQITLMDKPEVRNVYLFTLLIFNLSISRLLSISSKLVPTGSGLGF